MPKNQFQNEKVKGAVKTNSNSRLVPKESMQIFVRDQEMIQGFPFYSVGKVPPLGGRAF